MLVPGLLFFAPALSGIDVAGLFKLQFREVKEKLDQQKQAVDDVAESIRVIQQTMVSQRTTVQIFGEVARSLRRSPTGEDADVVDIADVLPD